MPSSACFLQSSFSLRPTRSLGWQTKSLNKATGSRQLIKMLLFALRPGCHLRVALSSQTAKQNSRAAHAHTRPAPPEPPCPRSTKLHHPPRSPVDRVLETQRQAVLTWGVGRLWVDGAHPLCSSWGAGAQGPQRPCHPPVHSGAVSNPAVRLTTANGWLSEPLDPDTWLSSSVPAHSSLSQGRQTSLLEGPPVVDLG